MNLLIELFFIRFLFGVFSIIFCVCLPALPAGSVTVCDEAKPLNGKFISTNHMILST